MDSFHAYDFVDRICPGKCVQAWSNRLLDKAPTAEIRAESDKERAELEAGISEKIRQEWEKAKDQVRADWENAG